MRTTYFTLVAAAALAATQTTAIHLGLENKVLAKEPEEAKSI